MREDRGGKLKYCISLSELGCNYVWESNSNTMYPYKYKDMPTYSLPRELCPPCDIKSKSKEIIAMWVGLMYADMGDPERVDILSERYNHKQEDIIILIKEDLGYDI